jgi:hydrogenase maturation protease
VIEPDDSGVDDGRSAPDAHNMNPLQVMGLARSMGSLKRILLVGCEPGTFGPEEGQLGLSPEVERAVDGAVEMVRALVRDLCGRDAAREEPPIA